MSRYTEDEYLSLSGIQHYVFCKRQWALIHIEMQWAENLRTVEGEILHKNAHDKYFSEKRGAVIISRAMAVCSSELGINGECDIVEFYRDDEGVSLHGRDGLYKVCPVEYKRGKPKESDADILQLTAQAICLEEMLCCEIEKGCLFYGETRRRTVIEFTDELRSKVREIFLEMHQMYNRRHTPRVRRTKSCNACSLKDICLPALFKSKSAGEYIQSCIEEDLT
ncbi:MAG: CRISPR-associated protein Cas4 [Oscillospiraceae bacterium]|jgi:CRISPR-associated exonuclease Cas4